MPQNFQSTGHWSRAQDSRVQSSLRERGSELKLGVLRVRERVEQLKPYTVKDAVEAVRLRV